MSSLDDRARRAAQGLKTTVAGAELRLERVPGPSKPFLARPVWTGGIGMAIGAIVLAGVLRDSTPTGPLDTDITVPTVTTEATTTSTVVTTTTEPTTTTAAPDTLPPALEITAPADGSTSKEKVIAFEGTTEPGATVKSGKWEADVDAEGNWSITLVLSEGSNRATFVATDAVGNTTTKSITVKYEKQGVAPFKAYQKFGECPDELAYELFYGSGQPGHKVEIYPTDWSPKYTFTIPESGKWEKRVELPGMPVGARIDNWKVWSPDTATHFWFSFKHTEPA